MENRILAAIVVTCWLRATMAACERSVCHPSTVWCAKIQALSFFRRISYTQRVFLLNNFPLRREVAVPNPESQLSTLAEIAAFMKEAYPALVLSIGKNGDHYAYRIGNIRILRFFQTSPTAALNLKKSLTTRLDHDKTPGKYDQPWSGTSTQLRAIVDEELRQYRMHFQQRHA